METLPRIQGKMVTLRPITDADTDLIVAWRNSPAVRNNFIFREEFTPEMHRHWLATKVATGEVVQYIVEITATGQPIGSVYYRDIDHKNHSAECGIFLGAEGSRGHGYGFDAWHAFVPFGFEYLKLHRIYARILEKNIASRRTIEKNGFVEEGLFRDMVLLDGQYHNVLFVARLADETGATQADNVEE